MFTSATKQFHQNRSRYSRTNTNVLLAILPASIDRFVRIETGMVEVMVESYVVCFVKRNKWFSKYRNRHGWTIGRASEHMCQIHDRITVTASRMFYLRGHSMEAHECTCEQIKTHDESGDSTMFGWPCTHACDTKLRPRKRGCGVVGVILCRACAAKL